ncbi:uncharacterized protein LOC134872053 isoform X1 [Eleginops maclovinus]|uniref:uncharacterized protein LOC134872053 isoform X1 n=1 Tax=Eleginops maclovinus TaxID=56733 RepID=UPI0030807AD8
MIVVRQPGVDDAAEWATGVCDCCQDMRECCRWFWCCPCSACRLSQQLGQCLCLPLLDVCGCIRPITFSMRVHVRQRYGIRVRTKRLLFISLHRSSVDSWRMFLRWSLEAASPWSNGIPARDFGLESLSQTDLSDIYTPPLS